MCTPKEYDYPYRSSDGSCNHITNDGLGKAYSAYSRFLPAEYSDGVSIPRRAHDRKPLPNARIISNSLFRKSGILNDHATMVVLQWAEFVEHDLSRFASSIMIHSNNSIDCCDKDGFNLSPRYLHPFCSSIPISSDDDYYSKHNVQCMSYVKSLPAISSDCSLGPNEQINQATHFLDGSQIYGTTPERTSSLRAFVDGKLKFSKILEKPYLPLSPNPTKDCQVETSLATCFISGDSRVNFLPHVTVMYTLWMREHNRIATELAKLNVDWDDEKLFQETRRIVIAEMQHITYNEWIYEVLDYNHIQKIEKTIYDGRIDPRISNSFASAAMRSFWSMMSEKISLVSETRQNISHISVEEHFNRPDIFLTPGAFDSLVRGFATQSSENIDIHYAEDLTNKFSANGKYGYDVVSLDIQRSRDHGLPDYNTFRSRCGLRKVNTFAEFADHMTPQNIHILSGIYSDPNDVDLIIGALMEQSEADSLMGPTFSCLIEDQLIRTKKGDRYFYSNKEQPKPFSDSQMEEIQKVTLARLFCDNSDEIQWMQPNVFKKIGESNNPVRCDGEVIPRVSLMPWLDQTEKYLS
ncbi:hypothetical protein JTB14_021352 [Gonioctena quinquepunctata]|nr:hypothetical protein JTB14_021352 [Gonioctena quinquepunctata]